MPGYRPANRGNRTPNRVGTVVSRRLRAAGVNVSPSARKYRCPGIFVSTMGSYTSIMIDLLNDAQNDAAADDILSVIRDMVQVVDPYLSGRENSGDPLYVRFDYKV
jgi:hypothetical protein